MTIFTCFWRKLPAFSKLASAKFDPCVYHYQQFNFLIFLTDTGPYIEEILSKVDDEAVRQNISEFLINKRRLDVGDLLGKGMISSAISVLGHT